MDIKNRLTNNGHPFKIQHKFMDACCVPDVAIDNTWKKYITTDANVQSWRKAEFVTSDGVLIELNFISSWKGDQPTAEETIKKIYKHDLAKHKIFYNIHNNYSYWHYIKMVKI